ncbi:hypothetical protein CK203_105428, partial [Vitis vinifera]
MPELVNEKDSCGRSPLHYAAASGALALVDHLLQLKPSNGSFLDNNLATPAHMAAENGHLNTDEDGNTPLHLAAAKLHSSISHKCLSISHCNQIVEMNIVSNFWQLVSPSNEGNEGTDGNQAQATPNKTG